MSPWQLVQRFLPWMDFSNTAWSTNSDRGLPPGPAVSSVASPWQPKQSALSMAAGGGAGPGAPRRAAPARTTARRTGCGEDSARRASDRADAEEDM